MQTKDHTYHEDQLTSAHKDDSLLIVSKAFTTEPMSILLGISQAPLHRFFDQLMNTVVEEGLSSIALDENDDIAAVMLSGDQARVSTSTSTPMELVPVMHLLDLLDEALPVPIVEGEILHIYAMATDSKHTGRGVMSFLASESIKKAQSQGYKYAVAEATSSFSKKILEKMGFQAVKTIEYKKHDFEVDEDLNLFVLVDHPSASLMFKKL